MSNSNRNSFQIHWCLFIVSLLLCFAYAFVCWQDLSLRGFWLQKWMTSDKAKECRNMIDYLLSLAREGNLKYEYVFLVLQIHLALFSLISIYYLGIWFVEKRWPSLQDGAGSFWQLSHSFGQGTWKTRKPT